MTRTAVREHIFKLLFRIEFNAPEDMPEQVRLYFDDTLEDEDVPTKGADIPEKDAEYIRIKYEKILELLPEIDNKIADISKGWSLDRIGKVELTVLRLGVFEIIYDDDIPVGVAIDEAVELAKKYGQDGSSAFVNGILAAVAK